MEINVIFLSVFSVFIPALVLPGPDFVAVVRSSMAHGTRAGLLTTLGVSMGLGMYATLSLLGLSAILAQYQWLAWVVRICGGTYLAYLGLRLVLSSRAPPPELELSRPAGNPLVFGFLVTLTNPKAIVLFASVFAASVTEAVALPIMMLMILLVVASSLVWYSIVSLFMSSNPVISRFRRTQHWIERAAGACFIGIAGKILADSRNPAAP